VHLDIAGYCLVGIALVKLWLTERRIRAQVKQAHAEALAKFDQIHTLVNHELEDLKKLIHDAGMAEGREALLAEQKESHGSH
jgi:endonuclease III